MSPYHLLILPLWWRAEVKGSPGGCKAKQLSFIVSQFTSHGHPLLRRQKEVVAAGLPAVQTLPWEEWRHRAVKGVPAPRFRLLISRPVHAPGRRPEGLGVPERKRRRWVLSGNCRRRIPDGAPGVPIPSPLLKERGRVPAACPNSHLHPQTHI